MREYGLVYTKFWTDPDVQCLSEGARLLALYLLTGPHTTAAGCFRCPLAYVAADLGISVQEVQKRFSELARNGSGNGSGNGFANRCPNTDWVIIPKFLRYNPIANPNCGTAVARSLECLPRAFSFLSLLISMLEPFANRLPNGFVNGLANRMPNQEQEQEQEKESFGLSSAGAADACAPAPPGVPEQEILRAYHERLPALPRVRMLNKTRCGRLRARWTEDKSRQSPDWWDGFFSRVAECPHLLGENKSGWRASWDWLMEPQNMLKILEGNYDRRAGATPASALDSWRPKEASQ